jgi:hypothetical protein
MSCTTCGNTCGQKCGCETGLVTPPSNDPQNCPSPNPCSETFDADCIIYTGLSINCGNNVIVPPDTSVGEALNNIVDYFCEVTPPQSECECLYTAIVSLDKDDLIVDSGETLFPGKAAKLVPITVAQDEAIEVVSASFKYTQGTTGFIYASGNSQLSLRILGLNYPQFTNGLATVLQDNTGGLYLMQNYEYGAESGPNMAFGNQLYVVVNGVANTLGTPDGEITFNVLYRKVKY